MTTLRAAQLHSAIQQGDVAAVQRILESDASVVKETDDKGRTGLYNAILPPNGLEIAGLLIQAGADVNARNADSEKGNALGLAAFFGKVDLVRLLLAHGVPANQRHPVTGQTPRQLLEHVVPGLKSSTVDAVRAKAEAVQAVIVLLTEAERVGSQRRLRRLAILGVVLSILGYVVYFFAAR